MNNEATRSELEKAKDEYFLEGEGVGLQDPSILMEPGLNAKFLCNRLEAAFIAGWKMCEEQSAASVRPKRKVIDIHLRKWAIEEANKLDNFTGSAHQVIRQAQELVDFVKG